MGGVGEGQVATFCFLGNQSWQREKMFSAFRRCKYTDQNSNLRSVGVGLGNRLGEAFFSQKLHKEACVGARHSSGFEMYQALFFMTIGCGRGESMGPFEN